MKGYLCSFKIPNVTFVLYKSLKLYNTPCSCIIKYKKLDKYENFENMKIFKNPEIKVDKAVSEAKEIF